MQMAGLIPIRWCGMRDYAAIAAALQIGLDEQEVERARVVLEQLENAFAPLRHSVPVDLEPATKFFTLPGKESGQ